MAVPASQTQSVGKWDSTCLRLNQRSSDGTNDGTGKIKIQKSVIISIIYMNNTADTPSASALIYAL